MNDSFFDCRSNSETPVSTGIWICLLVTEKAPLNPPCEGPGLFQNDGEKNILPTCNDTTTAYGGEEILGEVPLCGEHFFVVKQKR